jgi:small basic protein (TIGR04137 family)
LFSWDERQYTHNATIHCPFRAIPMSIHPSLRGIDTLVGQRSVYTRVERLQKLMRDGKISEEDSPFGLPKVRTFTKIKAKKKSPEEEAAAAAASEAEESGASEG